MTDSKTFEYDVCIVGTGRVGLPLGLSLLDVGMQVVGVDVDPALRETINGGKMPFHEPGYDELVSRRAFKVHANPDVVARARNIVITVGTPLHSHIETDLRQIERVLESIRPYLLPGQLVCLRSTVAPGTTSFVKGWIERATSLRLGHDLSLVFCPERIAEGQARHELTTLPQIVGSEDERSKLAAVALFEKLSPELLHTNFAGAELVKLFNNIARYVHFAVANQFALIADTYGANIYELVRLANYKFTRSHIATPGLTAGTCLRKDFGMLSESLPYPDMLLSAWKINEYIPSFLVRHLLQRTPLKDAHVALLGYAFKSETDDIRDSLSPKLHRYIQRELPIEVRVTDHFLPDPIVEPTNGRIRNWPIAETLAGADCVFVGTNHKSYREALMKLAHARPNAWIVDIWNTTGSDKIFFRAGELIGGSS